jgi:hypothetical protein
VLSEKELTAATQADIIQMTAVDDRSLRLYQFR